MTESTDRRLHRLHDDDLTPQERAEVESEIAAQPELGRKLEGLREVGVVLRAARTDDAPIDDEALWSAIEARLSAPAAKPALRAIEGGATRAAPAVEDPRARRRRLIGIAVGTLAIAAAALLMFLGPPGTEPESIAEVTPPESAIPDEAAPQDEGTLPATDYTEVLAVDFGTNVGTIFAVEGEGGQRYAVVWLDDVLKRDESDLPGEDAPEAPSTPD